MKRFIISILITAAIVAAGTRVYEVDPSENDNGMAGPPNWVGQTFVLTCDTLKYVDVIIQPKSENLTLCHWRLFKGAAHLS